MFKFLSKKQNLVGTDENKLQQMFDSIKENTDWDINGKLLYGYFFFDKNKDKLAKFAEELKDNYKIVDIEEMEDQSFRLHIEEKAIHNSHSLAEKNKSFHNLANEFNIQRFDGYDVGAIS